MMWDGDYVGSDQRHNKHCTGGHSLLRQLTGEEEYAIIAELEADEDPDWLNRS